MGFFDLMVSFLIVCLMELVRHLLYKCLMVGPKLPSDLLSYCLENKIIYHPWDRKELKNVIYTEGSICLLRVWWVVVYLHCAGDPFIMFCLLCFMCVVVM